MPETPKCPECRHIFPRGVKCKAPALRGKPLCYHHSRKRTLVDYNRYRQRSVALPPLEDRAAIQTSIDEVLAAFAAAKIDRHEAWLYLLGIRMASKNLDQMEELPAEQLVDAVCLGDLGEVLAPEPPAEAPAPDEPCESPASEESSESKPAPREDKSISIHLPHINRSDTHEYDNEPHRYRPMTRREQQKLKATEDALSTHFAAEEFKRGERERQERKAADQNLTL